MDAREVEHCPECGAEIESMESGDMLCPQCGYNYANVDCLGKPPS